MTAAARIPLVVGAAGGVGTTCVAAALAAYDGGQHWSGPVDAVVCFGSTASLGQAQVAIDHCGTRPLLLVVAAGRGPMPRAARARMTQVSDLVQVVVRVPWVPTWREVANPWQQAAAVLRYPDQVPRWLRPWRDAMRETRTALLARLSPPQHRVPVAG